MFELLFPLCLATVVLVAAATDLRSQRVPNIVTVPAALVGVGLHGMAAGGAGLVFSGSGLVVGFGLLIAFYAVGGMGAGDVKLMAAVGSFVGAKTILTVFLLTTLIGGVYALGLWLVPEVRRLGLYGFAREAWVTLKGVLLTGEVGDLLGTRDGRPKLCYAVCIALATLAVQIWGIGTGPQAVVHLS